MPSHYCKITIIINPLQNNQLASRFLGEISLIGKPMETNISNLASNDPLLTDRIFPLKKSVGHSRDTIVSSDITDCNPIRDGLEALIKSSVTGVVGYFETGSALCQLKSDELYKPEFTNFYRYCQDKFGLSKPRVQQLIRAVAVTNSVEKVAKDKNIKLSEGLCRELHKIKDLKFRAECLKQAAENKLVTAKTIHTTYRKMTLKKAADRNGLPELPKIGTVVRLATKQNPDLKHLNNYWGVVKEEYEFSVAVKILSVLVPTVHPQDLIVVKDGDHEFAERVIARLDKLFKHPKATELVSDICKSISTRPYPQLADLDFKILEAIEIQLKR